MGNEFGKALFVNFVPYIIAFGILSCLLTFLSIKLKQGKKIAKDKINQKIASKKTGGGICPNCGGKLIMRNGKYGRFIGCSNYPKCKYTQK